MSSVMSRDPFERCLLVRYSYSKVTEAAQQLVGGTHVSSLLAALEHENERDSNVGRRSLHVFSVFSAARFARNVDGPQTEC
jgi:hypothetical protein